MTDDAGTGCAFVVERAKSGPCQRCYGAPALHPNIGHDHIGKPEATCGHPESEHHPEQQGSSCGACGAAGIDDIYMYHAFTEAP